MLSDRTGKVQTVLGLIEPQELGITHTHEHVLIDLSCYSTSPEEASERSYVDQLVTMDILANTGSRWKSNLDNRLLFDEREQERELKRFRVAGGGTLVDVTSIGIGRDPLALARMSRATGINLIMGAAHYVPLTYTQELLRRSEDEVTESIVHDITVGVGDTGVKSGIIGEVGNFWPTNDTSRRVLRAAGAASKQTGASVIVHPGYSIEALFQHAEDLVNGGAESSRIIMGHLGVFRDLDSIRRLADSGVMLEYDCFGTEDTNLGDIGGQADVRDPLSVPTDTEGIDKLVQLMEWGLRDHLVIAHDVCRKPHLTSHGGKGYAHIIESIVPRMRKRGFSEEDITTILVRNPARVLTFD